MCAQPSGFRPCYPASFSIHPQTGTWRADQANDVNSMITDDQCFVKQFERNVLATKTMAHASAVKVTFILTGEIFES